MEVPSKLLIDGQWLNALDGEVLAVTDPATGEVITDVPAAKAADINRAVTAAQRCFDSGAWDGKNALGRSAVLHKAAAKAAGWSSAARARRSSSRTATWTRRSPAPSSAPT